MTGVQTCALPIFRLAQGDLPGALTDITFAIDWAGRQTPVDERSLAIVVATPAGIRQDQGDLPGLLIEYPQPISYRLYRHVRD